MRYARRLFDSITLMFCCSLRTKLVVLLGVLVVSISVHGCMATCESRDFREVFATGVKQLFDHLTFIVRDLRTATL
jgi:hypothetical protein